MSAPEIGQALAAAALVAAGGSYPEEDLTPIEGAEDAGSEEGAKQVNENVGVAGDGSIGLDQLPDEDLVALAAAQQIAIPQGAGREAMIACITQAGITRVLSRS